LAPAPSVLEGRDLVSLRRSARDDPLGGAVVPGPVATELRRGRGAGEPLPTPFADAMGGHFGMDLSAVRVHADPHAGQIARSVQAAAFTHGDDIYFAPGAYRPASGDGQRMLAHELSHIAAQRSGADTPGAGALTVGRADDPAESAADRSADRAMAALRRTPAAELARPGILEPPAMDQLRRSPSASTSVRGGRDTEPARPGPGTLRRHAVIRRDDTTPVKPLPKTPEPKGQQAVGAEPSPPKTRPPVPPKPSIIPKPAIAKTRPTVPPKPAIAKTRPTVPPKPRGVNAGPTPLQVLPGSDNDTESEDDGIAGPDAEAVIQAVEKSGLLDNSAFINKSPKEIQAGFDLWFGVRKGNAADVDVTKKRQAAGEVYGGGGAAVTGRAAYGSAEHELPFGLTITQYHALVQASAIIGVHGAAKGQLRAKIGKKAYTGLKAGVTGFVGAKASAQGSAKLSMVDGIPFPVGAKLAGSASAFVGAQADGNATFTLAMNPAEWAGIGADIGADFDAKAGAWADASGEFVFDPLSEGIVLSGTASAFAGVSAEVGVSGSAKLYGRKAFTVSTSVSGSAGVGGKASGGFSLKGGKLILTGKLEGALGPGMGGGVGVGVDFKPIAVLINREIAKASWKVLAKADDGVIKQATDPALATHMLDTKVKPRLVKYRDWKLSQLGANLSTEYVKMENIQMIIDQNWPRTLIKVKNDQIDSYIIKMLQEILGTEVTFDDPQSTVKGAKKKVVADVRVEKGLVKVLQFVPRDIASILGGTVSGKHGKGENANAAYSPHGLAQG
jgi:hypothetical protein